MSGVKNGAIIYSAIFLVSKHKFSYAIVWAAQLPHQPSSTFELQKNFGAVYEKLIMAVKRLKALTNLGDSVSLLYFHSEKHEKFFRNS